MTTTLGLAAALSGTSATTAAPAQPQAGRLPPGALAAQLPGTRDPLLRSEAPLPMLGNQAELEPGLPTLFALLQQLPPALMAQLPPRAAALLENLQRQVLGTAELGDARRLRQHLMHLNGLAEADEGAAADPGAAGDDLKALMLQLLSSLQANRRLVLKDGMPGFVDASLASAYCLQAYADEQSEGTPWKRLRALLSGNVETAVLGMVHGELQAAARNDEKMSRWIMHLLLRTGGGTQAVPLVFSRSAEAGVDTWELAFDLELRHLGRLHVVIAVKNTTVSVSLAAARTDAWMLLNQRLGLGHRFDARGLTLGNFACQRSGRD